MQNSGYISSSAAQLSEEEKQNALQILADMFNCHTDEQLRSICESQCWNVERCIDFLISENDHDDEIQRSSGAIPKQNTITDDKAPIKICTQKRQFQNGYNYIAGTNKNLNTESNSAEERIAKLISDGSKVMILMRGVPGSGKTSLAKSLVERYVKLDEQYTLNDFIFSSDDFFYNSFGQYKWQRGLLDQAHEFNQRRVLQRAQAGWSPIFVDNTNVKLWEMIWYAQVAVKNGYVIELLEPTSPWRKSANKLAQKTKHGVQAEKIQVMLNKFEKGTVEDLLKLLNSTKYTVTLPQLRSIPPIQYEQQDIETNEIFQIYKPESHLENTLNEPKIVASVNNCPSNDEDIPKPQRDRSTARLKSTSVALEPKPPTSFNITDEIQTDENKDTNIWQPHEKEIRKFWNSEMVDSKKHDITLQDHESLGKSLLDLLREGTCDESKSQKSDEDNSKMLSKNFERHSINCPNENKGFSSLRQIYPNKELASLWDLFVKCDGDIDWTVDLLLREEELMVSQSSQYTGPVPEISDEFCCNCSAQQNVVNECNAAVIPSTPIGTSLGMGTKPQRQRTRAARTNQRSNPELREITDIIANRFVLDGEQFSPHVRKLREMREKLRDPPEKSYTNTEVQTDPIVDIDPIDDNAESEVNEIIEVNLGDDLVRQLKNIFQDEMTSLVERLPDNPLMNVFMPKSLAKELYMLWVESAYNQLEEQKQKITSEDARFARLLKNPKYENYSESPKNVEELLDMELAWQIYKNDNRIDIQKAMNEQHMYHPNDLAAHLTQLKLCENFPNIPRETLIEILRAHGNNYDETVRVLTIMSQPVAELQQELLDCTLKEQEMIKNEQQNHKIRASEDRTPRAPLQPDEAKRKALHDFEEMRNLAAHHCQLKAECYQKAKEAIQKGNSAVAVYYSQVANLHKMKLDMYNHRAANCIMDVHKYTQNNPELLDLHYLHVMEAIGCLDIFLDRHITGLRATSRTYKHIFIITGRGLHSTGGVSTIKNKVKGRLKERNLRWSEVNPGLLKVKIFSASKHSKNI